MMRLLAGLGLLVLVTCCTAQHQPAPKVATSDQYKGAELEEYFSDSLHIGRKGHNKIEMSLLRTKDEAIKATGASAAADMGKLMAVLKPQLAGKADMAEVSKLVKSRLSN